MRPVTTMYISVPISPLTITGAPASYSCRPPSRTTLRASHRERPAKSGARRTSPLMRSLTMSHTVSRGIDTMRIGVSVSSASIATSMTNAASTPKYTVATKFDATSVRKPAASAIET